MLWISICLLFIIWLILTIFHVYKEPAVTYTSLLIRANFFNEFGRLKRAIAIYEEGLQTIDFTVEEEQDVHYLVGVCYCELQQYEDAVRHFNIAFLAIRQEETMYRRNLEAVIYAYEAIGHYAHAQKLKTIFNEQGKINPDFNTLH